MKELLDWLRCNNLVDLHMQGLLLHGQIIMIITQVLHGAFFLFPLFFVLFFFSFPFWVVGGGREGGGGGLLIWFI